MFTRLFLATLALAAPGIVSAETAWRPFQALKLYVSDETDDGAEVFTAAGHFLVAPSSSKLVYVLSPKDYTVHGVERSALKELTALDLADESEFNLVGVLEKRGASLKWESDDVRYALSAKPPLIGSITLEELREHTDKYESDIVSYVPDITAVRSLSAVSEPTEIVVGFGTWCPICAEWLPRFIKSIEQANNDAFSLRFISINEDLDRPADLLETYAIDGVPTFVVRRGGKELGRITQDWLEEEPDAVLERRLVEIVSGS